MTQHTLKSNFETVLLPPKGQFFDRSGAKDTPRTVEPEPALLPITGVHPAVIKIAMSAVVWFLAAAWFEFLNDQIPNRQGNHAGQGCCDPHSFVAGVPGRCRDAHWPRLAPAIVAGED